MNPQIKARWVEALRSGEYPQGKGYLNRNGQYCCLGVLCELAVQDEVVEPGVISDVYASQGFFYDDEQWHLPQSVAKWAGMPHKKYDWDSERGYYEANPRVGDDTVAELNDKGVKFEEIADRIEEYL